MKKLLLFGLLLLTGFAMLACEGIETVRPTLTDAEKVAEAAGRLPALFPNRGEVRGNLNLPVEMIHGVTLVWESSDEDVIATNGRVSRPMAEEGNIRVTLTATLSYGAASDVVSIEFVVLHLPEGLGFYTDFAKAHSELTLNDDVLAEGVVVSIFAAGYFLYDGENFLSVYRPNHSTVSIGDRAQVLGRYNVYHTLYQIGNVANEDVIESGLDATVPIEEKSVSEIVALDSGADRLINGTTFRTQGQIQIKGTFNNVFIVDGDDELLVYFMSLPESIAALETFEGQIVELDVIYYTNHSRDGIMVVFQGGVDDVTPVEVDEEAALNLDIATAVAAPNYTFGDDIVLPAVGALGSVFTDWTSSHPELIADDGTYVAMPESPTEVTFTGTATFGEATGEVTVKVDALAPMTMEEAILVPDGRHVMVEGVVQSNIQANRGFFIYDGTAHMYVRDLNVVPHPNDGPPPFAVGEVVHLVGVRDTFAGIPQIAALKHIETTDTEYDLPENIGEVDIADIGAGVYPAGTIVTLTGIVQVIRGNFTDVRLVDGDDFVQIHHNTGNLLFVDFEDELVTVEVTVFQWDHRNNFVAFFGTADDIAIGELSDDDLAAIAAGAIDLGDLSGIYEDLELPLVWEHPEGWEASFAWASDNEAVIAPNGTVTRTSEEVVVTLTVTVTVGEGSAIRTFEVTVLDEDFVPEGMTVAEALLEDDGTEVLLQGVVSSYPDFAGGFFIQDSDGTAIYIRPAGFTGVEIGNLIVVRGTLETFTSFGNTQRRIADPVLVKNEGGDHDIFVDDTQTLQDIVNDYPNNSSMRFRVYDIVIQGTASNTIFLETDEDMLVRFDTRNYGQHILDLYEIGDTIPWIEFTVYDISFSNLRAEGVYFPELTDAQIEALLEARINVPEEATGDLVLPLELVVAGVNHDLGPDVFSIHWASDNEAITAEGVVTRPEAGEDDVHVILTATISAEVEVAFHVFVLAESDEEPLLIVQKFDFGSSTVTGYAGDEITFTNTWDDTEYTLNKSRMQINNFDGNPAVILSPHSTAGTYAYIEFDLSGLEDGEYIIEFDYTAWSQTAVNNLKNENREAVYGLEVYDDATDSWILLENTEGASNLVDTLTATYQTTSYEVSGGGIYRISINAPGSGTTANNTAQAGVVDNVTVYRTGEPN
ncbi:MAG: hypothetical protein EA374_08120 [Acholeplasmatales bacterium]|nr:MAG: hypothetical protein EA374_08120 [Acholeplasmatales bacterium]